MRVRYYQSLIDMNNLKRGQHYSSLNESFIIFICPFDSFKQRRHFYSFSERCDQDPAVKLNNKTHHIFLSTKGTLNDVQPDIKAFLNYVDSGIVSGKFVKDIACAVDSVKSNQKVRHDFMTFQMYLLEHEMEAEERGLAQGIERGRTEGTESVAIKMLRKGKSIEEVREFTDLPFERLKQLAKNNSIA